MIACKGKADTNTGTGKDTNMNTTNTVFILKSIGFEEGMSRDFTYDEKKRIIRVEETQGDEVLSYYEIKYSDENTVTISEDDRVVTFTQNGDTITIKGSLYSTTLTLNKEGLITKRVEVYHDGGSGEYTYQYSGGNMIKSTSFGSMVTEYKYDNMHSIYNCNTPKWLIQHLFDETDAGKNNVSEIIHHFSDGDTVTHSRDITYNEDNYPTCIEWGADSGDYFYMTFGYFEN